VTERAKLEQAPSAVDEMVLMAKDPWWVYAYWTIHAETERDVRRQLKPEEIEGVQSLLRVFDISDGGGSFDIPISSMATTWYIHANAPGRTFMAEVGIKTRSGRFIPMARSNAVSTPRIGPSDAVDPRWALSEEEYWEIYAVSGGLPAGTTAEDVRRFFGKQATSAGAGGPWAAGVSSAEWLSSGAVSSFGLFSALWPPAQAPEQRDQFWLRVDTELIVYGATDPKAKVTIQGQPVQVAKDGTFSARFALPDGTQTIPVEAVSPNGRHVRRIIPIVSRKTAHEQPREARRHPAEAAAGATR